ncbi:MAG: signal recognition particle protein, partial [Actinomycetota bacterium]
MFDSLSNRLSETFKSLRGKGRLSAADIDETLRDIRKSLLEADVALDVVKAFIASIRERALGDEVSRALNPAQQVVQIVNSELVKILGGETRRLQFSKTPPTIIMLAGLQGSGKTTFAAKLANLLKNESQTPLLVACDLQRPNAVDQLRVLGEKISVPVFAPEPGNGVGNPVSVAKQAIDKAKREQHSVVIIDTAGRTGIDQEMMQQAIDIRNAIEPDELIFVIDSMLGQDAVSVA